MELNLDLLLLNVDEIVYSSYRSTTTTTRTKPDRSPTKLFCIFYFQLVRLRCDLPFPLVKVLLTETIHSIYNAININI